MLGLLSVFSNDSVFPPESDLSLPGVVSWPTEATSSSLNAAVGLMGKNSVAVAVIQVQDLLGC